jgi:type III pantothenate kinase
MFLIIDVGNTRVKAAVYEGDNRIQEFVFPKKNIIEKLQGVKETFPITHSIISSVALFSEEEIEKLQQTIQPIFLSAETKVPFYNLYESPKTLGVDRIALAAAAIKNYPNQNTLVIDAGTCITFDFITKDKEYIGGAISPGIEMRYKALHQFTSKLPLLQATAISHCLGTNTEESIHIGIIYGVCNEIEGLIQEYRMRYPNLTIVLTGGDTNFLAKQLKSSIFANPNFVLEGLHTILIYNIAHD